MSKTRASYIGILCIYSPVYATTAISKFHHLMHLVTDDPIIIIVSNKDRALAEFPHSCSCFSISGSNHLGEFSAWDEGVTYYHTYLATQSTNREIFVFANDTFCHHRKWLASHSKSFVRALRRSLAYPLALTGWASYTLQPLIINGRPLSLWVSTFLFSMDSTTYKAIGGRLAPSAETLDKFIAGDCAPDNFFGTQASDSLKQHLRSWLFHGGWYKSAPLSDSNCALFALKAKCILSEKLISSKITQLGGSFILVNRTKISIAMKCRKFLTLLSRDIRLAVARIIEVSH